jgi:hypothetical protein
MQTQQSAPFPRTAVQLAVDEYACAEAMQLSVAFLRKDRISRRLIPFYRIGKSVRYNLDRVREALSQMEEGGPAAPRRRGAAR